MKGEREKSGARKAAKLAGLSRYETGLPCARGHVSPRYVTTGTCTECAALKVRAQGRTEYFRERYLAKRDKILQYHRERYSAARPEFLSAVRSWQDRNKDLVRAYKTKNKHMRRAREGSFRSADVDALLRIQRGCCVGCGKVFGGKFHIDHIIPLSRGGTNWCGNLQLLCQPCNSKKAMRLPVEWRYLTGRSIAA